MRKSAISLIDRLITTRCIIITCFVVIFMLWSSLLYRTFSADIMLMSFTHPADYALPSYKLSKQEYNKRHGLPSKSNIDMKNVKNYPALYPLGELLSKWPSTTLYADRWNQSLTHPSRGSSGLYRFNFQNETERHLAFQLRDLELPFIVYNVPELQKAAVTEFTLTNLLSHFGRIPRMVERSSDHRFMYYTIKNPLLTQQRFPGWTAPQQDVLMSFPQFLAEAETSEHAGDITGDRSLHYLIISATEGSRTQWIRESLPFFEPEESLFMKEPDHYRGINCRFGMKGVIAAAHYDGRRNFIAMIRGRKRYVLLPPSECNDLKLFPRGHPSARHSSISWSNLTELRQHPSIYNAKATEVVVSMGEMLYIPSYWFHYIISLDASIQCNARSGESDVGKEHIANCGFSKRSEEVSMSAEDKHLRRKRSKQKAFEWSMET